LQLLFFPKSKEAKQLLKNKQKDFFFHFSSATPPIADREV